mgnify:CR=1 FL=1
MVRATPFIRKILMQKIVWIWALCVFGCVQQVLAQKQSSDSVIRQWLYDQGIPVTTDNKIKLLKSGVDKFDALFDDVRLAEHSVHLDYFAMRNDSISNTLFNLLAVKKKQGVEARALFDAFANFKSVRPLKKRHLKALNDMGIEIKPWDRITFPWVNHAVPRDHRKIVVIDGQIAYTGGMNVADYYLTGIPKAGPWRDMQVRIEGPAANEFQKVFLQTWNKETKKTLKLEWRKLKMKEKKMNMNQIIMIIVG